MEKATLATAWLGPQINGSTPFSGSTAMGRSSECKKFATPTMEKVALATYVAGPASKGFDSFFGFYSHAKVGPQIVIKFAIPP
jgi:hypothetical protein